MGTKTRAAAASFSCDQPKSARAVLICLVDTVGEMIGLWPHLEEAMILVMAALLGGIQSALARQVFRSLNSE